MPVIARLLAVAVMSGVAFLAPDAPAQANALHGFCAGATPACYDNGTNTPTGAGMPSFGFTASSGFAIGDYRIDILVPDTISLPSSLSFGITGTQGGLFDMSPIASTASLFSTVAWTSGNLGSYLGLFGSSPNNPIGAFLPATQALVPDATGFFVYQADLGLTTLRGKSHGGAGPLLNLADVLPEASYIVAFLDDGFIFPHASATANSGALFETGTTPSHSVPEPGTMLSFGAGLLLLGMMGRRVKRGA